MHELLLSIEPKEMRLAVLQDGRLQDLTIERTNSRQITGNIYRGRVTNILHNIQSAFIDIAEGENGFIHISDIVENTKKFEEMFELDFETDIKPRARRAAPTADIRQCLAADQPVLVQVVKEPIGSKGARLTSNVSLAGRYLVLLPNTSHRGVSRKIEDRTARERLKKLIRAFEMPQDMGLICRTASQFASQDQLVQEAHELLEDWDKVKKAFNESSKPTLLFQESDLVRRALMMAVDRKFESLIVDDHPTYLKLKKLYQPYAQEHDLKIVWYKEKVPMFERYGVDREIERALRRKIWLPSGGYLYLDRTEAMTTIDVNSGRSLNGPEASSADVEESLLRINMEAAEEISRQLRIRNLGGLIVCDFIDMRSRRNQKRLLERLKDCMREDAAKCTVLGMSEFGLVEMTRQRHRESLQQTLMAPCPYCMGHGHIKSYDTTLIEIERDLRRLMQPGNALKLVVHPELERHLSPGDHTQIRRIAERAKGKVEVSTQDTLHLNEYQFFQLPSGKRVEV
ncbi:MAG: Rne/Rng family ribonuclease [Chlamydiia bacterium]